MGKVVLDMTTSLNGCVAGPNDEPEGLHDWFFAPSAASRQLVEEKIRTTGALVLGRRTYDMGASEDGFVDNPFPVAHFVVTHTAPDQPAKGDTSFTFVSEGVAEAVRRARQAAGERDAVVGGGADIARQCLAAGLIDEVAIALRPVVIDGGLQLFERVGTLRLERLEAIDTPEVTHLRFRVVR